MPANKLPWPTIITSQGDWGRFKREELRKAILEVKALHEAEAARERKRLRSRTLARGK
jgi:hypothetical protein